jgi:alkylation response protein AidB-like acyl-CoA dehydrogenase
MLEPTTAVRSNEDVAARTDVVAAVRAIAARELAPLVQKIDAEGHYPESVLRAFGGAGAFAEHLPGRTDRIDLATTIRAMSAVSEYCLSTAFCMWCQNALGWYIFASANETLKLELGHRVAIAEALGGTALSNPMKTFFGIEGIRLKGRRVAGGYTVRGLLPFVSNLGDQHYFGAVFAVDDEPQRFVMAVVPCAATGLSLSGNTKFVALDGTRTFAVQMHDVMIPDQYVLADPSDAYVRRIRAGFVLLQTGMALGLIRDCIAMMQRMRRSLGHINKYLELQPEQLRERLAVMEAEVAHLASTPFESDQSYWRAVIEARLAASETSVAAAHAAMLHCGARGYVSTAAAQRRLREAYFVAIVTPAIKQLRKMLADMKDERR